MGAYIRTILNIASLEYVALIQISHNQYYVKVVGSLVEQIKNTLDLLSVLD